MRPLMARGATADNPRIMRFLPFAAFGAALPDLAIGIVFLVGWIAPGTFPGNIVPTLMLTMLLEFIIIHSSALLGNVALARGGFRASWRTVLMLCLMYTLFVAGFAAGFKTWWPLASFWVLTMNRLLGLALGQPPEGQARIFMQRTWAVGVMFYLLFVFVTTLLPIPPLGIRGEFRDGIPGSGLWVSQPWRVVAFGFMYFTAVGISELFSHRWLPENGLPDAQRRRAGAAG